MGEGATSPIIYTAPPAWMREKNIRYDVAGKGFSRWRITYLPGGKKKVRTYLGFISFKAVYEVENE